MPHSLSERFRAWYEYERDCNAKTLSMLASVPEGRRADPNYQRAIDKFAHMIAARHSWACRLGACPDMPSARFPAGHTLETLAPYLESIEQAWVTHLAALDDAGLDREFEFAFADGPRVRWNVRDLLTQTFGHAWYHRGQIALLVKDLGGAPIETDFIGWCGTVKRLDIANP